MPNGIPEDIAEGTPMVEALAADFDLDTEPLRVDLPQTEAAYALSGAIDGVRVRSEVRLVQQIGVAISADTTCALQPTLGLGLKMVRAAQGTAFRSSVHLPDAWWRSMHSAWWGSPMATASSEDPYVTRTLLGAIAPPFEALDLRWLRDDELATRARTLGAIAELRAHILASARFARALIEAAEGCSLDDHEALPRTAWGEVATASGGELDPRRAAYRLEAPWGTLHIAARWHDARQAYRVEGTLRWETPFPAEGLTASSDGGHWLFRWLRRDVRLGDDEFDRAFLVQGGTGDELSAVLAPPVRRAAMALLEAVDALTIERDEARFHVAAPADAAQVRALVAAGRALAEAVRLSLRPGRCAYR